MNWIGYCHCCGMQENITDRSSNLSWNICVCSACDTMVVKHLDIDNVRYTVDTGTFLGINENDRCS